MKTNRLFALGLMTALASGACGDDSGSKTTPVKDSGTITLADGAVVPNPGNDGGGITPGLDGGPGADGGGTDGGGGGTGSKTITAAGGSVTSVDGRLTVTFSRYALTRPTNVTITVLTPAPDGAQGTVYDIEPKQEALNLNNNAFIKVALKYTTADLGGGSAQDLKVGQYLFGRWVELTALPNRNETQPKANPNAMELTAYLSSLGPVGLIGGICTSCPTPACTPGVACTVSAENATPGTCVQLAGGCNVCRQGCDADHDGFCQVGGNPGNDCNDGDAKIRPSGTVDGVQVNWPELCNGIDDNCNNITDEGCKACDTDAACTVFGQSCIRGFCDLCSTGCDDTTAAKNCGTVANPGHCVAWGMGCSTCVQAACDLDGDGQCPAVAPALPSSGDCDETNRYVNSGVAEVCGNNIDDDCNGFVDDNCSSCSTDAECPNNGLVCLAGSCAGCSTAACDPAACGANGGPNGSPGRCATIGKGCNVCVAACDGDADGACATNGDCDDGNPSIRANGSYPDICGNNIDDNCNNHKDEGCTACASDADCKITLEACTKGACQVCDSNCNTADNCRWPLYAALNTPTIAGACIPTGNACLKCVPPGDADGDGFVTNAVAAKAAAATPSVVLPGGDCDDTKAGVRPTSNELPWPELCGNTIDDNCNGAIDELCTPCETSMMCGAPEVCDNTR